MIVLFSILIELMKAITFFFHWDITFHLQRYLGTVREEETLNILLEFVPGGSISSLLGKFGPFPEAVSLGKQKFLNLVVFIAKLVY